MGNEKREAQKKNREKAIRKAQAVKSIKWIVISLMIVAVLGVIGWAVASSVVTNTKPVSDYSEGLNEDGTIKDVRALDYVTLCDYKNITVARSEVELSDEEMQAQIDRLLNAHPDYDTDTSIKIKDGDTINLDYVGSIDGVEFQGGSTGGAGTLLTIGSHSYIDGFEDSIIGHNVGENFDIHVTFPEDYGKEDLNGKEAVFNITINSVQKIGEFDDAFVKEYLSDVASTKEEYIKYYKDSALDQNLKVYISDYIRNNSTVNDYPKDYLKTVKGQIKNTAVEQYESVKESLGSMTFEDYVGQSKKEYEASLTTNAMKTLDDNLKMQAICEDANLTVTEQDVKDMLDLYGLDSAYYSSYETEYGKAYLYQTGMTYTVLQHVQSLVNITD